MREEILCHNESIRLIVPQTLLSCREAITKALEEVRHNEVVSSWFDAGSTRLPERSILSCCRHGITRHRG
jgi:hypothetical protein